MAYASEPSRPSDSGCRVAAGVTPPVAWQPSTINVINVIIVLDAELEHAAAVTILLLVGVALLGRSRG